jgi:hypothetical protein
VDADVDAVAVAVADMAAVYAEAETEDHVIHSTGGGARRRTGEENAALGLGPRGCGCVDAAR